MEIDCNICNAPAVKLLGKIQGYRKDTFFEVMECNNCGTKFTYPIVSDERIYEAIYNNVAVVPGYSRYLQYAQQILLEKEPLRYLMNCEDCYWGIVDTLMKEIGDSRAENLIWEIGSGQGYLTYALVNAGFNSVGLDISATAVASARSRYGEFYFCEDAKTYFSRTNERPSFIILSEVIEHLTNPTAILSELLSYLRPGGSVIVTTPNKEIYRSNVLWDTDLPPVHLWWFSQMGLQMLGKKLSCHVSFANLDGFYNENLLFINPTDDGVFRTPVFDKEYCIINMANKENAIVAGMKGIIKRLIPRKYFQKLQLKKALSVGLERCTSEKPMSLCAIYSTST